MNWCKISSINSITRHPIQFKVTQVMQLMAIFDAMNIYIYIYIEGTTSPISLQCSEFQTACVGKPTELQDLPHHRLSLDLGSENGNSTNDGRKTPVIFASQKIANKESQIKTQTAGTVATVQECP